MDGGSSEGNEARFAAYVEALGVVLGHADRHLSLLSMARLNIARSRPRPSSWSLTRIVRMSFGFKGRFWPIRRPLFQGARRRGGESELTPVMVASIEADPLHPAPGRNRPSDSQLRGGSSSQGKRRSSARAHRPAHHRAAAAGLARQLFLGRVRREPRTRCGWRIRDAEA